MAKSKKHIHKYHRISLTYAKVWACALPTCYHFMPKHLETNVPGKTSICWNCGEEFILDETNMKNDKPICANCDPNKSSIADFLDRIGVK